MATSAVNFMKLFNFKPFCMASQYISRPGPEFFSIRNYAARRGTRERKAKLLKVLKKRAEDRRIKEARAREQKLVPKVSRRFNDSRKRECIDNIVIAKYFKWKTYSFEEAVECHRETHHPTVYNLPNAPLNIFLELDMKATKKNKYIETFQRIVTVPHGFNLGEERSVLVFCKSMELQRKAVTEGAKRAGGVELVKEIEKGDLSLKDYDFILCHPEILPEIVPIRGLMKKRFPNVHDGTLGPNIEELIKKFLHGIKYYTEKDQYEKDYASVDTVIGTLDMKTEHLRANLEALLKDIYSMKPKRPGPFITSLFLKCEPSVEKFKLNAVDFVPEMKQELAQAADLKDGTDSESEDEEEEKRQAN